MPGWKNAKAGNLTSGQWPVVSGQFYSCPTEHWPLTTDH
jgi:hypothetical protein